MGSKSGADLLLDPGDRDRALFAPARDGRDGFGRARGSCGIVTTFRGNVPVPADLRGSRSVSMANIACTPLTVPVTRCSIDAAAAAV
jgi:hypothetical protein